jgi:hypothetical protein
MKRRHLYAAGAVALLGAGLVTLASPAAALGGEQGKLLIRSTGSVFTLSDNRVSRVVKPGKPATYTLGVLNTGPNAAQYRLSVTNAARSCPGPCNAPTIGVKAGSVDYSALNAAGGFFTNPVAAGATASFTVTFTPAADAGPGSVFFGSALLQDTAGSGLSAQQVQTSIAATTGSGPSDEFVTTSGESSSLQSAGFYPAYNGASLTPGKSTVFKVKLQNDSLTSTAIQFHLIDVFGCAGPFPATVKAGSADVTSLALAGTYVTAPLAPKKSQTLSVTIKYLSAGCTSGFWDAVASADGGTHQSGAVLLANPAA